MTLTIGFAVPLTAPPFSLRLLQRFRGPENSKRVGFVLR